MTREPRRRRSGRKGVKSSRAQQRQPNHTTQHNFGKVCCAPRLQGPGYSISRWSSFVVIIADVDSQCSGNQLQLVLHSTTLLLCLMPCPRYFLRNRKESRGEKLAPGHSAAAAATRLTHQLINTSGKTQSRPPRRSCTNLCGWFFLPCTEVGLCWDSQSCSCSFAPEAAATESESQLPAIRKISLPRLPKTMIALQLQQQQRKEGFCWPLGIRGNESPASSSSSSSPSQRVEPPR